MKETMATLLVLEKSETRRYTLGVVYEPDSVDTQGDFAKAEDIESAAWDFMARLQHTAHNASVVLKAVAKGADVELDVTGLLEKSGLDDEHLQVGDDVELGTIVESYVAPCDMTVEGQPVKKGAWLLGVRWSDEMFSKIKKGERTGLSMYGRTGKVQA